MRSTYRCTSSSSASLYRRRRILVPRFLRRQKWRISRRAPTCRTGPTISRRLPGSTPEALSGNARRRWRAVATAAALPAFWVGLLYDDASLDAAWNIVKTRMRGERQAMRDDVPRSDPGPGSRTATCRNREGVPGAVLFGVAAAQPPRSRRPRRDPASRAAATDHRHRPLPRRGDAGEIQRPLARLGRAGLPGICVLDWVPQPRGSGRGRHYPDQSIAVFCRSSAVQVDGDQMANREPRSGQSVEAIPYVEWPPAQGVFGDAAVWRPHGHAGGICPGQFRPSGRRLSKLAGGLGRSGRLRTGVRTRPALPFLELQLSDRYQ